MKQKPHNTSPNISTIRRLHLVGIKGVAMSAFAVWAVEKGIVVTGSDIDGQFPTDDVLNRVHVIPYVGFSADHIRMGKPDLVVYTGAHNGMHNIEVQTAVQIGIPVYAHGKALGMIMQDKKQISVAGSHGKTTTTAMIATVLMSSGLDPSYAIGCGEILGLGLPGHAGKGDYFVAEADEYITDPGHDTTPRFLWQHPDILAVTNVDFDHPDAYASLPQVQLAFKMLQDQQRGRKVTIVNMDDPASDSLLETKAGWEVITYGFNNQADYRISDITFAKEETRFTLRHKKEGAQPIKLIVPGKHNTYNAAATAIVCRQVGVSWDHIAKGLVQFGGTKRRFEKIGAVGGKLFYDDYAHHPREIQATLAAARAWYPGHRIVAIFQPHTYSRTKSLLSEFSRSFFDADIVITTDIYASARETETLGITGMTLANEIKKHHNNAYFCATYDDVASQVKKLAGAGDVIIYMGAGSIFTWGKNMYNQST